jgi:hypothetical protein
MSDESDVPAAVREQLEDDPVLTVADWLAYQEETDG